LTNELEGVILQEEASWRRKPRINFASFFSHTVGIDRRREGFVQEMDPMGGLF